MIDEQSGVSSGDLSRKSAGRPRHGWRRMAFDVLFRNETGVSQLFDVFLMVVISLSVLNAMLESVADFRMQWSEQFRVIEWGFTLLFSAEYLLRLLVHDRPLRFVRSFFGLVDLIAVMPTWLGLVFVGLPGLLFVRVLRMLRVFRLFKLWKYSQEAGFMILALRRSVVRISVFLFAVGTIIVVIGSVMYLVEGPEHGFDNIFVSIYWTIVTITTVGYGDISPQTALGQAISSMVMILGYAIIAVPTGIVSAEVIRGDREARAGEFGDSDAVGRAASPASPGAAGRAGRRALALARAGRRRSAVGYGRVGRRLAGGRRKGSG